LLFAVVDDDVCLSVVEGTLLKRPKAWMKFGKIVLEVNNNRLTESDF